MSSTQKTDDYEKAAKPILDVLYRDGYHAGAMLIETLLQERRSNDYTKEDAQQRGLQTYGFVQHWIPVEVSTPKPFHSVIGHMTDADEFPAERECYWVGNGYFFPALDEIHPVSHWCYIPKYVSGESEV